MSEVEQRETGFAEITGARIYYEVAGDGPPLIFVHAGIADHRMWDDQFDVFSQHYRVVRYDMRGFGRSTSGDTPFAYRTDLLALLDHLHIDQAALVGVSMGGNVVLETALIAPERIRALVVVASAPEGYDETGDPPAQWDALVAAYKAKDWERAAELEVQIWVDGPQRTSDQVAARVRERVREMDLIALRNESERDKLLQRMEPPTIERLGEITAPTLLIAGDLDQPDMPAACRLMSERIPHARLEVIKGTAHLPNMERPDEFNQIILDFLHNVL